MARRYFEFVEGTSSKFWEVWMENNEVRTRYGKIGAAGQTTVKDEGSPAGALKLHDKLVREKTGNGYLEKSSGSTGPASEKVTAPMKAKPAPKAAEPDDEEEDEDGDEEEHEPAAEGFRRWEDGAEKLIAEKTKKGYRPIGKHTR